uniref:Uncharacterized protein n=1 Tax=Strigamia maritima TaxID=126957 RepID=T1J7W8_STRMM
MVALGISNTTTSLKTMKRSIGHYQVVFRILGLLLTFEYPYMLVCFFLVTVALRINFTDSTSLALLFVRTSLGRTEDYARQDRTSLQF